MGLSTSTTHRLLVALENDGYVAQDALTERYKLGCRVLDLARKCLDGKDLRRVAQPYLEELRSRTMETAHLMIFDSGEALCIDSVESDGHMRVVSPVGGRSALHCTAVGKAILAWLPNKQIQELISGDLPRFTDNTITDKRELVDHLATIKSAGVAFDNEERDLGVRCVAAPVFQRNGSVIAAVGISSPSVRFTDDKGPRFAGVVKEIADKIMVGYGM